MKKMLSIAELESQMAVELPDRELMAVVVGGGGLLAIQVAVDQINVNILIDVNVADNNICVNVTAVAAVAACDF